MTIDLSGRAALVTGASRGIGRAIAEALRAAGADVVLHHSGRNTDGAVALAADIGAAPIAADLGDADAASDLWDQALAVHGRLDIVVANAGIFEHAPLGSPTADWLASWQRTMAVNLTAPALLLRAGARHAALLREQGEAGVVLRAITVSSRAAFRGDEADHLAYAASKGGLVSLTRSIARKCPGVAAFGIAPGFTVTDMAAADVESRGEALRAETALDALARPQDVAPLAVLLASGLADHATGTTIDVNGASYVR